MCHDFFVVTVVAPSQDFSAQFHNALFLGDVAERIKILT
jgi:hypothetical protein